MTLPEVSVVIPFLNAGTFLEEAIKSVFAQTHRNWELCLVDDGSTDEGTDIAKKYAARDPERVRYFEHDGHANRGGAVSRNLGAWEGRGRYIAFLDADDVWLPEKLELQIEALRRVREAAMVFGHAHVWHSWETPEQVDQDYVKTFGFSRDCLVEPPAILISFLKNPGKTPFPSSILMRRSVFDEVGGFEEKVRGTHDDQAFFAKICLRYPALVMNRVVFKYRVHRDSICQQEMRSGQSELARRRFLEWLARYLESQAAENRPIREEVQRQLRPLKYPRLHRVVMIRRRMVTQLSRIGERIARSLLSGRSYDRIRRRLKR